ncbi:hypothetical protein NE237_025970 [Protea cynaroides]|uniref:Uncharacterized protein n=1 Tax=Protea cynaroides TaxID=273540 RepID=A0A9Q0H444_9MAGN|nr:hypothetical protein NE237_025970 [Protea cynaroides]
MDWRLRKKKRQQNWMIHCTSSPTLRFIVFGGSNRFPFVIPPVDFDGNLSVGESSSSEKPTAEDRFLGLHERQRKAALTVEPRPLEFTTLDVYLTFCWFISGAFKLSKEGFVLLQFAPTVAVRQYIGIEVGISHCQ